jgi:hypothetical protein
MTESVHCAVRGARLSGETSCEQTAHARYCRHPGEWLSWDGIWLVKDRSPRSPGDSQDCRPIVPFLFIIGPRMTVVVFGLFKRRDRGFCLDSHKCGIISPVVSWKAKASGPYSHRNNRHCRLLSRSKLCSRLERLREDDGRAVITIRIPEWPFVLPVPSAASSRGTHAITSPGSIRRKNWK